MTPEAITHRAAVLQYNNGQIRLESEAVADVKDAPGAKFDTPVAYAIFIYGEAPIVDEDGVRYGGVKLGTWSIFDICDGL